MCFMWTVEVTGKNFNLKLLDMFVVFVDHK